MFSYDSADITYAVTFGKLDGSSDIDYSVDLNKKEARIYTKARMLGQDLDEVMDTYRIEREIIRYERSEYGSDIRDARVSIWFCNNQEQPPIEDVKEYLKDLLKARKYDLANDVVKAQINVFDDIESDWEQIALDLANEFNCPGYFKKYKDKNLQKQITKPKLEPISERLKDALDNYNSYRESVFNVLKTYDSHKNANIRFHNGETFYSYGFYYIVTKIIDGQKCVGVLGHTGDLLLPCKYASLKKTLYYSRRLSRFRKVNDIVCDYFAYQEEENGLFGIVKIDGTVILKPIFKCLDSFLGNDYKHKMIAAGDSKQSLGAFSLELNKFITPCKYEHVGFSDEEIFCNFNYRSVNSWRDTHDVDYYDYNGQLIRQEFDWRMYKD